MAQFVVSALSSSLKDKEDNTSQILNFCVDNQSAYTIYKSHWPGQGFTTHKLTHLD